MASPDICGIDVQGLYLEDPGNKQEPVGYVLCSEMGKTCKKNGCNCRSASSQPINGSTMYFGVCVILRNGADCVTSGDDYITCAKNSDGSTKTKNTATSTRMNSDNGMSNVTKSTTSAKIKAVVESNGGSIDSSTSTSAGNSSSTDTSAGTSAGTGTSISISSGTSSTSASYSGSTNEEIPEDAVPVVNDVASSSSTSSTVMVVIIIVAVMFVAVTSWVIRWYCMRRLKAKSKLRSRRNRSIHAANIQATSPSNTTGRSSGTPSFPAFDRRTRGIQSPVTGERGRGNQDVQHGRLTPRSREQTSARGRRNPDLEFASNRTRQTSREHDSRRGKRALNLEGGRREPGSGRRWQTPDTNFVPNGPRSHKEAGMQYEPNSGRSRRDTYKMCKAETVTRNPTSNDAAPSSSGTVYTGRNTYERVAQFAQLAAFEAPSPSPVRPQRPIQSIPVSDAVPKHIRAPAQNARPAPSAPSMPKRTEYYIEESPVAADYDILSPKTARSLASVASSATTVVVPGRNRPTALQQGRRPQHAPAVASYYQPGYSVDDAKSFGGESRFSESKYDESGFGNKQKAPGNYLDSFMSKDSSMAWSRASGLSDDSYYLAPPTNLACIPVIEAPREDDDALSEDAYSDWGHSSHQTSDDFRSTAASYSAKDASFFSVNSDFSDSSSMFKEREF